MLIEMELFEERYWRLVLKEDLLCVLMDGALVEEHMNSFLSRAVTPRLLPFGRQALPRRYSGSVNTVTMVERSIGRRHADMSS